MNTQAELQNIQSLLFKQISSAASNRDVSKVAELSGLAKECERIETELTSLNRRVEAVKGALSGSRSTSTTFAELFHSLEDATPSSREIGKQARSEWIARLPHEISLNRHGKQYQTARGQSVGVAFSNEQENKWFLGLRDKPMSIVVLLCKSLEGKLHDIVLPVSDLPGGWSALSRSHTGVKFNVKKEGGCFLLYVPGKEQLDITRYIGNYEPLL